LPQTDKHVCTIKLTRASAGKNQQHKHQSLSLTVFFPFPNGKKIHRKLLIIIGIWPFPFCLGHGELLDKISSKSICRRFRYPADRQKCRQTDGHTRWKHFGSHTYYKQLQTV